MYENSSEFALILQTSAAKNSKKFQHIKYYSDWYIYIFDIINETFLENDDDHTEKIVADKVSSSDLSSTTLKKH